MLRGRRLFTSAGEACSLGRKGASTGAVKRGARWRVRDASLRADLAARPMEESKRSMLNKARVLGSSQGRG